MQNTKLAGQPLICQLLSYIPDTLVDQVVNETGSDMYYKKMFTFNQLVFMAYGIISKTPSLNCICKNLLFLDGKLSYLGINELPALSTLSDANINRKSEVFEKLYYALFEYYKAELKGGFVLSSINGEIAADKVKRFDGTTFPLFSDIFKGVGRSPKSGKKAGGIKAQNLLSFDCLVPEYIKLGAAAKNDKDFLGQLDVIKDHMYIFDKGYINYGCYQKWTEQGVFFTTRLMEGGKYTILKENPVDFFDITSGIGVLSDQVIGVNVEETKSSLILRLITYKDPNSGKVLRFLTNNLELKAYTICLLYKNRWAIEPFFKQIKQNFQFEHFYSDSEEGIQTQIWIAMIANLIFTIIFQRTKQKENFTTIVSMAASNMGSYICLISMIKRKKLTENERNIGIVQLNLFETPIGGTFQNKEKSLSKR